MQDPELEQKIEEVKQLILIWHQFYNLLNVIQDESTGAEEIARADTEFQKIKTVIAQKHSTLMSVVTKDDYIAQTVLATVRRTISLQEFRNLSELESNKVLIEWHEANVLLNETLGHLEYERDSLADKSATGKATEESMAALRDKFSQLRRNPYVKLGLRIGIVVVVLGLVYIYRHEISSNKYYIKYLKPSIDWVGQTLGLSGLFK